MKLNDAPVSYHPQRHGHRVSVPSYQRLIRHTFPWSSHHFTTETKLDTLRCPQNALEMISWYIRGVWAHRSGITRGGDCSGSIHWAESRLQRKARVRVTGKRPIHAVFVISQGGPQRRAVCLRPPPSLTDSSQPPHRYRR